ncbi:RHS repeat-associated core domain-containing protein [Candidatus Poribacteria bacterium]|nr:RHS repeat-associated core domain-containing protein [Candidatus Poribacteria bacterium]
MIFGGPALTLRAKGGKLSLSVPGGGEIVSGADGVLTLEPTADGAMRVQSLSGSGVTTQSRIRPSGPPSATLAAVEEYEYTPYGVPSVHAKEAAGAASLRVWDEAKAPASSAGALISNTREGKAYGNYLAVSDSPLGATTQTARKANSAAMSSIGLKYMYAGRPWSAPGEVSYNRARWYSPESGRFLSRDPIGYLGGAAQYMYVGGNPIMWRDPTGLEPEEVTDQDNFEVSDKDWDKDLNILSQGFNWWMDKLGGDGTSEGFWDPGDGTLAVGGDAGADMVMSSIGVNVELVLNVQTSGFIITDVTDVNDSTGLYVTPGLSAPTNVISASVTGNVAYNPDGGADWAGTFKAVSVGTRGVGPVGTAFTGGGWVGVGVGYGGTLGGLPVDGKVVEYVPVATLK